MSSEPGVLIRDVAESLCIHPFMLSRWRKQVCDGERTRNAVPLYGLLQALYVQQDTVAGLATSLHLTYIRDAVLTTGREVRNDTAGPRGWR
jgi:hypothetical protein